jgi:hypothetical protein
MKIAAYAFQKQIRNVFKHVYLLEINKVKHKVILNLFQDLLSGDRDAEINSA